jgi:hypothetical protein
MWQRFDVWEQVDSPSSASASLDASARLAVEIKQKALRESNAASERMISHEQNCPACNHKLANASYRDPQRCST